MLGKDAFCRPNDETYLPIRKDEAPRIKAVRLRSRESMSGMRKLALKWAFAGALLGAIGWFSVCVLAYGLLDHQEISKHWRLIVTILCPVAISFRVGTLWLCALNCAFYAVIFSALGFIFSCLTAKAA